MNKLTGTYQGNSFDIEGINNADIRVSKKLSEIGNPKSIKSDVSQTIKVPKTKLNKKNIKFLKRNWIKFLV